MLSAVDLNDPPCFHAAKVGAVGATGMLSATLRTSELAATHVAPQGRFGVASVPAQRAGSDTGALCARIALHVIAFGADRFMEACQSSSPAERNKRNPSPRPSPREKMRGEGGDFPVSSTLICG